MKTASATANSRRPMKTRAPSDPILRLIEASVPVTPDEIRSFEPDDLTIRIAEQLLIGDFRMEELADSIGVSRKEIEAVWRHPLKAAWISRTLYQQVAHMTGLATVAMFHRACRGNVSAYSALIKTFGLARTRDDSATVKSGKEELESLSTEELERIVEEEARRLKREVKRGDATGG